VSLNPFFKILKIKTKMKKILSAILLISVQITVFSQRATLEFINNPTSGNDITFEVFLKPDAGTTIYLGNFDITIALPNGSTVSNAVRTARANILSVDGTSISIFTSISSDGNKINYQPSAPGDQSDFNTSLAKITTRVSLGTYKITFASPTSGTVSCGGSSFFTLAPVNPWASTNVPTSCSAVLPLDLLDFSVNKMSESGKNKAQIKWKTTNEKNVKYYEVEKSSTDSKDFIALSKKMAKNGDAESYDVIDENPFTNINYYRLKMVNIDGSFSYSSIKSVVFKDAKKTAFKVFPNPAFNSLTIDYALDLQNNLTDYAVVNMLGQTLMQGKLTSRDLDISSLPTGAFVIKVGEGQSKFFKQ
jgi:Secretion system C-terminal sorting domain